MRSGFAKFIVFFVVLCVGNRRKKNQRGSRANNKRATRNSHRCRYDCQFLWKFYWVLVPSFYCVFSSISSSCIECFSDTRYCTEFHPILPSYCVLYSCIVPSFTESCLMAPCYLLTLIELRRVLKSFHIAFYQVSTKPYRVSRMFTFYRVLPSFAEFFLPFDSG